MDKQQSTLPECLTITVDEVAAILGISRSLAYSFVEQSFIDHSPIKVLKIGKCYRVLRQSFFEYVLGKKEVSA
ncbi:MAG: helix-turn-helix domain-containing protein [Oscillospiraceae bacterium]|nr:helix-turn-helix domain-containing protein [Oscillospiraceae bacterium]